MPEGNNIILIWIFLIAEAGKCNKDGGLFLTNLIPFSIEDLAIEFDFEKDTIRLALSVLEKYEMIEMYDDIIYIKNWEKYQNIEGMAKIREQNRLRNIKYRQKMKLLSDVSVTSRDATDIDIDKDIDNNTPPLKKEQRIFTSDDKEYLLAKYLSRQIAKRLEKSEKDEKTLQSWSADFNKMVRLDKLDIDEMKDVLVFSQSHKFWKNNILSAVKFRKQYLTLLSVMKGEED